MRPPPVVLHPWTASALSPDTQIREVNDSPQLFRLEIRNNEQLLTGDPCTPLAAGADSSLHDAEVTMLRHRICSIYAICEIFQVLKFLRSFSAELIVSCPKREWRMGTITGGGQQENRGARQGPSKRCHVLQIADNTCSIDRSHCPRANALGDHQAIWMTIVGNIDDLRMECRWMRNILK